MTALTPQMGGKSTECEPHSVLLPPDGGIHALRRGGRWLTLGMTMEWGEGIEQAARDGFSVDRAASADEQTDEVLEEAKAAGIDGDREWARD